MERMEIKTNTQKEVSIIKITGELDASNAVRIDAELIFLMSRGPKQIWIDGQDLDYVSSAGLGVFLSHLPTIKLNNINLVFFNLNAKIRNVFNILGLDELLQVVPDLETAELYYGSK